MIDTNILSYIAEILYVSIEEQCIGKTIFVREGSNLTTFFIKQPAPNLNLSSFQWDDTLSANNHVQAGIHNSAGTRYSNVFTTVAETPNENEQHENSEKTVTLVGNVDYDINEEMDLVSKRSRLNANFRKGPLLSDEDCPPGFQKILNAKKFKKKSKSCPKELPHNNTFILNKKPTKKVVGQSIRNEIAEGAEINLDDSIEPWSEDDFAMDRSEEERRSKNLGRILGFGVDESLDIDDLLK